MRRRPILALVIVGIGLINATTIAVATEANPASEAAVEPQEVAPLEITDRSSCEGSIDGVLTNLVGQPADLLETLQAEYEAIEGFRAVVFDGRTATVVVAPEELDAFERATRADDVQVVASCVSTELLEGTMRASDALDIGSGGFSSAGYDGLRDSVFVMATAPAGDIKRAVEHEVTGVDDIKSDVLRVTTLKPGQMGNASRGADGTPHWGGARIITNVGGCSTGFYLNSSTHGTVMLTAGHCYNGNGDVTTNGNNTANVGASEGVSRNAPDLALLDGSTYAATSYSANNQTTAKAISASGNPTTGVVYCQMGATSLRKCSAYSSLNASATTDTGTTHGLAYTSGPSGPGGSLGSGGDSGGGVFRELSSNSLSARGMVKAAGCDVSSCARWDHRLSTITSFYSATVVTQ